MINQRVLWATAFASMLPGWAVSNPPIPFGGWSVSNGIVTAGCAAGAQCATPTVMPGMFQRGVTGSDDSRYLQSILTDGGANGLPGTLPFSSESFVPQGGFSSQFGAQQQVNGEAIAASNITSSGGIFVRQEVNDAANGFLSSVTINTGVVGTATNPNIRITQQLLSGFDANMGVQSSFTYEANLDANGNRVGFRLFNDQYVDGSSISGSSGGWGGNRGSTDSSVFALREVAGNMLTTSGSASFSGSSGGGGGWGGGGGGFGGSISSGTVSWVPGNDVKVVWVAQPSFGFQTYDNLSDARNAIVATSISSPGPFSWFTTPFGPRPALPSGSGGGGNGGWGW